MVLEPATGLVRFVVGLLVGGLAIYVAARVVTGESSFGSAVVTAVVGAVAWGLTALLLGWVPLVGSLLPLVVWVGVVKWRYDVGWVEGAVVGFLAWFVSALALLVLPFGGDVFGVPFV
jgi:hypothetical protein